MDSGPLCWSTASRLTVQYTNAKPNRKPELKFLDGRDESVDCYIRPEFST